VARRLHTTGRFDETCIGTLGASSPVLERWGRATAVIMAAGEGRRFGAIKQMAPWRGTTYIEHAIQVAEQSQADEVLVVLGAHADQIRPTLKSMTTKTRIVMNERWLEGMSTSLIAGLGHTASKPSALIFMNVDQPAVTPLLIDRLIARHRVTGAAIVAPRFQGMRGNPTLWDRSLFGELRTLTGDVGGREILRQHWRDIAWIELDSEEELTDTDTPEEYQRLKEILRA
ncbi:MAG: nucleotidyltransferase family protein, partial [Chloroflexi bacterium]|nr:nucleotidyltransferase family protein [Chloroflexota bacterium]